MDLYPLLQHRMDISRWKGGTAFKAEHPDALDAIRAEIDEHGPRSVKDLPDAGSRSGPWWGWSNGKIGLEVLYRNGELADYFRLKVTNCRPLLAEMVEAGELLQVEVEGWDDVAYLDPEAKRPRSVNARALLSPFDPVVWFRPRAERLFDFHYRIEIYVPEKKRVHGYYVLPFLLGDKIVGRVDLKADRKAGQLLAKAAFVEPGHDKTLVAEALAQTLHEMAEWLELDTVKVGRRGDLASALSAAA